MMKQSFFLNMAYPAAVICALLYVAVVTIVRLTGLLELESAYFILGLFLLYPIIWVTLFLIDRDRRSRNLPANFWIEVLCRNTGVAKWNYALLLVSIVGCVASIFVSLVLLPLPFAVAVGSLINLIFYSDEDWQV